MKRGGIIFVAILLLGLISLLPSYSQVLYDDFSEPYINRDRWKQAEFAREVDPMSEKLLLKLGTPNPVVIPGYPYNATNELFFSVNNPVLVNSIRADVTIMEFNATNDSCIKAKLGGTWYSDGTIGDIGAEIAIKGEPSGLRATWTVVKFLDEYRTTWRVLGAGDFKTTISTGTVYTLHISYNRIINRFFFKIGTEWDWFGPKGLPRRRGNPNQSIPTKVLSTEVQTDDATSSSYIFATFDNVYKNGTRYDDFSSSDIDLTKWSVWEQWEMAREISGGYFRSRIKGNSTFPWDPYNGLEFTNPSSVNLLHAKVTPMSYQNEYGVADVAGYIAGFFYNDGSQRGGMNGEVEARIQVGGRGTAPVAEWEVRKYLNPDGNFVIILGKGVFTIPIILENNYILFLGWSGREFVFRIEDVATGAVEEVNFSPTDTIEPPTIPWKEIGTRIYVPYGEAEIEVLFDDVFVSDTVQSTREMDVPASDGT